MVLFLRYCTFFLNFLHITWNYVGISVKKQKIGYISSYIDTKCIIHTPETVFIRHQVSIHTLQTYLPNLVTCRFSHVWELSLTKEMLDLLILRSSSNKIFPTFKFKMAIQNYRISRATDDNADEDFLETLCCFYVFSKSKRTKIKPRQMHLINAIARPRMCTTFNISPLNN